jgi:drug/metabolite transporter (DMT)-like permease
MTWLAFIGITLIVDAFRIFTDNYVSDVYFKGRGAASQKLFYGYSIFIVALIILIISGFDFTSFTPALFLKLTLAGAISAFSGIFYYKALELDDSTNLGIFIQLAPVLYLILGWLFLGETISSTQLVSFLIIISAPALIIATTHKRSRNIQIKAAVYSFIYVLIAVISNLVFVKVNSADVNFVTTAALLLGTKSITNLIIVYSVPKWRRRYRRVVKQSRGKVFRPMIVNTFFGATQEFAYRAALVTAPSVALASAVSDSSGPIVIFFLGIILTLIWPKYGREKLERKTILVHIVAVLLIVAGVVLLRT